MSIAVPIQTSFNGGKFSSRVKGRSDLAKYGFACDLLQNFIPTVQGPLIKRSGTRYVTGAISNTVESRLIPFEVSIEQSYVIELSEGVMRFFRDSGAVLQDTLDINGSPTAADPVDILTTTPHDLSTGDSVKVLGSAMTELNGRNFTINLLPGLYNFELVGENGIFRDTGIGGTVTPTYAIHDGVISNSIPWLEAELDDIKFVQNGDLMYLTHTNHPPHEIIRVSDTEWTCRAFVATFPALGTENTGPIELSIDVPDIGPGSIVESSAALFTADDVGRVISIGEVVEAVNGEWKAGFDRDTIVRSGSWIAGGMLQYDGRVYEVQTNFSGGTTGAGAPVHEEGIQSDGGSGGSGNMLFWNWGWGLGTITAFTDTTHVVVTVTVNFPKSAITGSGTSTTKWGFGAWDEVNGYPAAVAFYEDRLWFGATITQPQTFWGSASGDFYRFRITPPDLSDTGVQFTLLADTLNSIEWMLGDESLLIGTTGGEFSVDSGSAAEAITPSNIRVRRRSKYGTASGVQPMATESSILFVRRNSDVLELTYDFNSDRQVGVDLTQFAHNVLRPGVRVLANQPDPFHLVWAVKTDGTMACMTFDKQEDVGAWADIIVAGTDAVVQSAAVIPHPDGDEDQVWLSIERTIDGGTVRYIEFLEKPFDTDDVLEDAFFVDSGGTYDGAPATTITGLDHLEGEVVQVLADGARFPDATVASGQITLTIAASKVHVGYGVEAFFKTVRWNAGSYGSTDTTQGLLGRISGLTMRVDLTGDAIEYGTDLDGTMDQWERRTPADLMDAPVPLFTGDSPWLDMPSGWDRDRQIAIRHNQPTPATILSLIGKLEVEVP